MQTPTGSWETAPVVPRKGDVDRNMRADEEYRLGVLSSPARGTWIEIKHH